MLRYNGIFFDSRENLLNYLTQNNESQDVINYLLDMFDGKTAVPSSVPPSVTQRQFRTALVLSGFNLQDIENFIKNLQEPQRTIAWIAWEYSNEVNRDNPMLNQLAPLLGITKQQIDQLFVLAATL